MAARARRLTLYFVVCGVVIVALCFFAAFRLLASDLRVALPWSARDVHEIDIDLFPDYDHFLKARIPAGEFEPYARRLGLAPHTADRVYTDDVILLDWDGRDLAPVWWNPTSSLEGTWVDQVGAAWVFAKYENGWLFVRSLTH